MGEISREEILRATESSPQKPTSHFSTTKMLYILGGAIVLIGIIIFISQIWSNIGSAGRITVTLGLGLLMTVIGSILLKNKPGENIGSVFHTIGGLLIPGGAVVTLSEFHVNNASLWPVTITFGIIFLFYILLDVAHKTAVLTFFTIANATAFIYLLTESLLNGAFYMHSSVYAYLTMALGASYLLLGREFQNGKYAWNAKLVSMLYFFGSLGFLGAAFSRVFDSTLWRAIYFLIVVGGLFLATKFKSRAILVTSTIFLIAHISYITSKYFADSIGWPISLVILGFVFIALGYISIRINRTYIKSN